MARITRGIPTDRLDETAALLYDAFEQKLVHGIRPDSAEQGRRIIARSLTPELGWVALAEVGNVPTGALTAGGGYRAVRFMRLDLSQDA